MHSAAGQLLKVGFQGLEEEESVKVWIIKHKWEGMNVQ